MGTFGAVLLIVAIIVGIIGLIYAIKGDADIAFGCVGLCLFLVIGGLIFVYTDSNNEKEDDEYVTVVTSDYKVLDQSQMYITGEDTVVYEKYIIKYKK